ncbi:MAG: alpha/beta fold hydrolase [Thiolinea sp.]
MFCQSALRILGILLLWLLPGWLWAQTLVLIPGFMSQGMDWRFNQVTPALQASGWVDGGNYLMTRNGILNTVQLPQRPERVFYTLSLPNQAPIAYQGRILDQYLDLIYQQRQEPLILVGHSAGGVVARDWLVRSNRVPVKALVTIATPHLGTPLAQLSDWFSRTEMLNLANMLGFKQLPDAHGLFKDLREEQPGRYLYWLNHQPHPPLHYAAIVRNSQSPPEVDLIVPRHSQDMNYVYALRGQAERWNTDRGHFLSREDGYLLARIVSRW